MANFWLNPYPSTYLVHVRHRCPITLQGQRKTIDELTADERQMLGGLFNENIRLRCLKSLLSDTIAGTDIAEVTEERSCEGFSIHARLLTG
jgi:hypothetical protein